jgi:hypothetical protein
VEGAIGVELSARVLGQYESAGRLFRYLKLAMPYDNPGSLPDEDHWAIAAYLLTDRRLAVLDSPLSPSGADTVGLN